MMSDEIVWICKVQSNNDSNDGDWYDFHVVYSSSYRVPVLYFHAQTSGKLITALMHGT